MAAAMIAMAACTGGDGTGAPTSTVAPSSSTALATTTTAAPTTTAVVDPAGSVTLRVRGLTLPDLRAGGTGLRVVVRAASDSLTVRRRGGGGGVSACPLASGDCVEIRPDAAVAVGFAGGVELRATGAEVATDELAVTYLPAARTTTLVTPGRPAGACAARPCEATYSLTPVGAGPITVDGRGGGGRPRLVLTTSPAGTTGSNRTLATVEGGGSLSIRATVEAGWDATMLHHQQEPGVIAPVTAEISWP
jgi:hypothetical protein